MPAIASFLLKFTGTLNLNIASFLSRLGPISEHLVLEEAQQPFTSPKTFSMESLRGASGAHRLTPCAIKSLTTRNLKFDSRGLVRRNNFTSNVSSGRSSPRRVTAVGNFEKLQSAL